MAEKCEKCNLKPGIAWKDDQDLKVGTDDIREKLNCDRLPNLLEAGFPSLHPLSVILISSGIQLLPESLRTEWEAL